MIVEVVFAAIVVSSEGVSRYVIASTIYDIVRMYLLLTPLIGAVIVFVFALYRNPQYRSRDWWAAAFAIWFGFQVLVFDFDGVDDLFLVTPFAAILFDLGVATLGSVRRRQTVAAVVVIARWFRHTHRRRTYLRGV